MSFVSADIISFNAGGSDEYVIIPEETIEGFFFGDVGGTPSGGGSTGSGRANPRLSPNVTIECELFEPFLNDIINISGNLSMSKRNAESIAELLSVRYSINTSSSDAAGILLQYCSYTVQKKLMRVYILLLVLLLIIVATILVWYEKRKQKEKGLFDNLAENQAASST